MPLPAQGVAHRRVAATEVGATIERELHLAQASTTGRSAAHLSVAQDSRSRSLPCGGGRTEPAGWRAAASRGEPRATQREIRSYADGRRGGGDVYECGRRVVTEERCFVTVRLLHLQPRIPEPVTAVAKEGKPNFHLRMRKHRLTGLHGTGSPTATWGSVAGREAHISGLRSRRCHADHLSCNEHALHEGLTVVSFTVVSLTTSAVTAALAASAVASHRCLEVAAEVAQVEQARAAQTHRGARRRPARRLICEARGERGFVVKGKGKIGAGERSGRQ